MNKPLLVISLFWIFLNCFGNAGVFRGYGQAPVLEKSSEVQMVEEEVIMIPRRGDYPMDLSCRNFDRMDFRCRFRLRNLSDREVELQVGFPLSTEAVFFHDPGEINQSEIISRFAFTAGTRETVYKVRFVPWDKERRFSNLFLWEMKFAPGEEIELLVNYTMEGYLGLGMTRRERDFSNLVNYQCEYLEFMSSGISQTQSYVTETGSSWAGEIEKARFRYYHRDFENYLARRGAWEETEAEREKREAEAKKHPEDFIRLMSPAMPMTRIWSPSVEKWQPGGEGSNAGRYVEVVYQPFNPEEQRRISFEYAFTLIPLNEEQFEAYCETIKNFLEVEIRRRNRFKEEKPEVYEKLWKTRHLEPYSPAVRRNLADVVLEFHGIARNNPEIADFLADQYWYPVREKRELTESYRQLLMSASSGEIASSGERSESD